MVKRRLKVILVIVATALLATAGAVAAWWFGAVQPADGPAPKTPGAGRTRQNKGPSAVTVAQNLAVPWALAFLPDGDLIFTERAGRVSLIRKGADRPRRLGRIEGVAAEGEGGLLGLAVHPDFKDSRLIYLYSTYRDQGRLLNRVVRYELRDFALVQDKIIVDKIPGSGNHNGGRIKFGPDGLLYVATGDSEEPDLAQDKRSPAGKILRFDGDGRVPETNPFKDSPVYSLGHRNPQGLAWDDKGRLWATEHGPSGNDEVNLIRAGKNYGWPVIEGDAGATDLEKPVAHSNGDTWAPSGAAWFDGRLFFAGLRGQALFSLQTDAPAAPRSYFAGDFGRLRDVVVGPDGRLYLATSNNDGRGIPGWRGDQIIKIDPGGL